MANCPLHGVFYTQKKHLGNNLLSIIWNSRVSALEGLCMYGSCRENNQDPEICPLYRGVHYRGVSIKQGFTVMHVLIKNPSQCCVLLVCIDNS